MAKISNKAGIFVRTHIRRHIKKYGMPRSQAVASAYAEAREKGYKIPRRLSK